MLPSVLLRPALLCMLTLLAFPAAAQSFYKCKMPNGQVRYSDQPSRDSRCKSIAVRTFTPSTPSPSTGTSSTVMPTTTNSASTPPRNTQIAPNTAAQVAQQASAPVVQQAPASIAPRLNPAQPNPRIADGSNRLSSDQSPVLPQL